MFFRNLTLFRFSPAVAAGLDGLEEALAAHRFVKVVLGSAEAADRTLVVEVY